MSPAWRLARCPVFRGAFALPVNKYSCELEVVHICWARLDGPSSPTRDLRSSHTTGAVFGPGGWPTTDFLVHEFASAIVYDEAATENARTPFEEDGSKNQSQVKADLKLTAVVPDTWNEILLVEDNSSALGTIDPPVLSKSDPGILT